MSRGFFASLKKTPLIAFAKDLKGQMPCRKNSLSYLTGQLQAFIKAFPVCNMPLFAVWKAASYIVKSVLLLYILGSMFPEKIEFDGEKYRTNSYNKVLDLIYQQTNELRGDEKEKGERQKSFSNSVPRPGTNHLNYRKTKEFIFLIINYLHLSYFLHFCHILPIFRH